MLLVNNAGVGATAPLLDSDVEKMDDTARRPLEGVILPTPVAKRRPNTRR
jgi:short-subunit dehydrogenase